MPTAPFPAILSADAQISAQALVCFRGNSYSVGPGMAGTTVTVAHRLGTATLDIVSPGGVVLARHRRQPDSAGAVIRHDEHVSALEHAVLAAFTDRAPCRAKTRRPPSEAARAEAARITATPAGGGRGGGGAVQVGGEVVIDFARYVEAAADRQKPSTGTTDGTRR